jgi:L-alanine-DL-glutamate epimerase-like enolase superfamily enzyme
MNNKIKDIEIFEIGDPTGNSSAQWSSLLLFLKITTDDGHVGWGEAPTELMALPMYEELKEVGRIFIGKDVTEVRMNVEEVYKHEYWMPISMQTTAALSAFEMASWDAIGRIYGIPVFKLFGGVFNKKIRAYANAWYDNCVDSEDFVKKAKAIRKLGFTAIKFDPFGDAFDNIDSEHLMHSTEIISALRQEVPEMDILIECHGRFNANAAIRIANEIEKFGPMFMEEPVHPDQIEGLERFRQMTTIKTALGERVLNRNLMLPFLKRNLTDVIQPDVANFMGLMEAYTTSMMARSFGVEVAFHNAYGPIQNAATLNLDSTIPNFLIQECFEPFWPNWKKKIVKNNNFKLDSGYFSAINNKPGLGVEVNEKLVEESKILTMSPYIPDEPGWVVRNTYRTRK